MWLQESDVPPQHLRKINMKMRVCACLLALRYSRIKQQSARVMTSARLAVQVETRHWLTASGGHHARTQLMCLMPLALTTQRACGKHAVDSRNAEEVVLTGQESERKLERPLSSLVIDNGHGASDPLACCISVRSATSKDVRLLGAYYNMGTPLQTVFLLHAVLAACT